jgi:hypothetical protein
MKDKMLQLHLLQLIKREYKIELVNQTKFKLI